MGIYDARMQKAIPGQLQGALPNKVLPVLAGTDIPFGSALFLNSAGEVVTSGGTATNYMGIAGFEVNINGFYPKGSYVNVIQSAAISVITNVAVKLNDKVYVTPAGVFTNVPGTSPANIDAKAKFIEVAEANSVVMIDINM